MKKLVREYEFLFLSLPGFVLGLFAAIGHMISEKEKYQGDIAYMPLMRRNDCDGSDVSE